jgi:hypothetical protein
LPLVGTAFSLTSADDLVEALCGLFAYGRTVQTTARLVLFVEGATTPARERL